MKQIIGIICAKAEEIECIKLAFPNGKNEVIGQMIFYTAQKDENKSLVVALAGMGKVNAAACAQAMISHFGATGLINSGVSGALSHKLHIMDMVLADDVMYHDLEPSILEVDSTPHCCHFQAEKRWVDILESLCIEQNLPYMRGRIVTGDQFISDPAVKEDIVARTQGITTEMEGAAVGHVAYINNIPFAVVRCCSDSADDQGESDYYHFLEDAAKRGAGITLGLIDRI